MRIFEIVFSATGRTQRVARILSNCWQAPILGIDLSRKDGLPDDLTLTAEDVCIVAVGVYGGRIPTPAAKMMAQLAGNGASAVLVAVYGNRAVDDCLLEMKDILTAQGFRCRAAIAAVAEHSMMPRFGAGRPDAEDHAQLEAFAAQIREGLENGSLSNDVSVPGNRPYTPIGSMPLKIKTSRKCVACGKCAQLCPTGAISKDTPTITDSSKCILCMRCATVCPAGARGLPGWVNLAAPMMGKAMGLAGRKENILYL